jgi:hypothetical protein
MKQAGDKFTGDVFEYMGVKAGAGRGRPANPDARTPAQRKADQRARLKAGGVQTITLDVSAELVEAIKKAIKFKTETQSQVVERILRNQLLRKR